MSEALTIRDAGEDDLPGMVRCLQDDAVGGHGDLWVPDHEAAYRAALAAILADPDEALLVAERGREVVACAQLSFHRGLADRGARKAQLRALFVRVGDRGGGVGAALVAEAERRARAGGAIALTLVSNARRLDAHRFYDRLGFERRHVGFAKAL